MDTILIASICSLIISASGLFTVWLAGRQAAIATRVAIELVRQTSQKDQFERQREHAEILRAIRNEPEILSNE